MQRPIVHLVTLTMFVSLAGACAHSSPKAATSAVTTTTVPAAGTPTSASAGGAAATSLPPASSGPGSTPGTLGTTPKGEPTPVSAANQHPCTLVAKDEARTILGAAIIDPVEAPQGPTCIYRSADSSVFVTVTTGTADFEQLKAKITALNGVNGLGRPAYCGFYGQQTLFVPLSATRLLYITAPCATATKFAEKALPRLQTS